MIKLENISKKYGDQILFEDASVNLTSSKVKIKGENGIGKSVLLKMMVGYSVPDSGKVYYDTDKELGKDLDFIENAGVSINAPEFMKNWTGMENLRYLQDINKCCTEKKLESLIAFFSLDKDINKKYKTYSLGMKQKMRIIQALMDEPRYLILDEPFDALDKDSKEKAKEYLDAYLREDSERMLIYTSHTEEDDVFADSIVMIENKALIQLV